MVFFPTMFVGWMPRLQLLKGLVDEVHQDRVDEAEGQRLLDESVPYAIALQEAAGNDIVSNGECRRF